MEQAQIGEVYPEWISIYALKDKLGVTKFFVSISRT